MFRYKINPLESLKAIGYSSYRIAKEKTFNQTALQKMRNGDMPSWNDFGKLCQLLHLQPGDIIEWVDIDASDISRPTA